MFCREFTIFEIEFGWNANKIGWRDDVRIKESSEGRLRINWLIFEYKLGKIVKETFNNAGDDWSLESVYGIERIEVWLIEEIG